MQSKEALMVQAVFAMAQGAAGAEISDDACDWFVEHYHPWVEKKKQVGSTPREAWEKEGRGFLGKFKEIGRLAAKDGKVDKGSLAAAANTVERDSDCPYCPIKP